MNPYDIIVAPTNAYAALPHGTTDEHINGFSYTMTYNLTGWPAAVVRTGTAQTGTAQTGTSQDGLPIGVQIICKPWCEDVALAVAQHLQETFGGWKRSPL